MRKLSLLVDLDSTLVAILPRWLERSAHLHGGVPKTIADVTSWNSPWLDLDVLAGPGFFEDLPPMPGGLQAMRQFHGDGHRITVCTAAASPESAMHKLLWVKCHLPFLNWKKTIVTQAKEMVRADVLIDDSPSMHKAYRKAWPAAFIASIEFPYHDASTRQLVDCLAPDWSKPLDAWGHIWRAVNALADAAGGAP